MTAQSNFSGGASDSSAAMPNLPEGFRYRRELIGRDDEEFRGWISPYSSSHHAHLGLTGSCWLILVHQIMNLTYSAQKLLTFNLSRYIVCLQ